LRWYHRPYCFPTLGSKPSRSSIAGSRSAGGNDCLESAAISGALCARFCCRACDIHSSQLSQPRSYATRAAHAATPAIDMNVAFGWPAYVFLLGRKVVYGTEFDLCRLNSARFRKDADPDHRLASDGRFWTTADHRQATSRVDLLPSYPAIHGAPAS